MLRRPHGALRRGGEDSKRHQAVLWSAPLTPARVGAQPVTWRHCLCLWRSDQTGISNVCFASIDSVEQGAKQAPLADRLANGNDRAEDRNSIRRLSFDRKHKMINTQWDTTGDHRGAAGHVTSSEREPADNTLARSGNTWAWASGSRNYDWMDWHLLSVDFS